MKTLVFLAALAVASSSTYAASAAVAEMPNQAGGKIVLTTRKANTCEPTELEMYSTSPQSNPVFGCWSYLDDRIWVRFANGGGVRVFEPEDFTSLRDGKPGRKSGM